jgi:hypothetical protein
MAHSLDSCGVLNTPSSEMNSVVRSLPVPKATELGPVRLRGGGQHGDRAVGSDAVDRFEWVGGGVDVPSDVEREVVRDNLRIGDGDRAGAAFAGNRDARLASAPLVPHVCR